MAVALRSSMQVIRSTNYALFNSDQINISVEWNEDRRAEPLIKIQGAKMTSLENSLEHLEYLLSHMRCIRTLVLSLETSSSKQMDALIEKFLDANNVRLEHLKVHRRYVGCRMELLPDLIAMNSETLRVISKIGLSEAVEGFNEKINLERLSLMNFDLVTDSELESQTLDLNTRECIRRLAGSGSKFQHLSYTTYSGFNLSCKATLFMLKQCHVKSIKLTMQKGHVLNEPTPSVTVKPLLLALERLELVGSLSAPRQLLNELFPNLEYYNYLKADLATGQTQTVC
jgi:hypothetical protein